MLDISFFRGARPKLQPHLLETGEASSAVNCRLQTGALQAFRGMTTERAVSKPNIATLHRYGDTSHWLEFDVDANVCEGPLAADTESTTYYTGDGDPAMTYASIATAGSPPYPSNKYKLGVPAPASTPTLEVTGAATGGDETEDSRVYVVTYVSAKGEEGPPCLPTASVDVLEGQAVNLTSLPVAPSGNYNITTKRIYRTSTASGDTSYLYVTEIPVAQTSATDSLSSENLGEVLLSTDWYPPVAGLKGLISLPNGVLAGFAGKVLWLSEPFVPHAWPYSITLDQTIVGLAAVRGGIVVATNGRPVIVSFTHPSAASQFTVESPRACASKRSMVDMGDFAFYASGDGLVAVDGAGNAPLITQNVLDRYQWATMNPTTMHAYRRENWYVCFYQGASGNAGFAITAQGDAYFDLNFYATAGFSDPKTGELYLVVSGNIVKWDSNAAAPISYTWRSGKTLLPTLKNLACARVDAESYPVTLSLYDDSTLIHSQSVTSKEPFWMPDNSLVRQFAVQLSGTATVRRVVVGESMEALT